MIRLILSGCNGKMGNVITRLIADDSAASIVAGFDLQSEIKETFQVYQNPFDFDGDADVLIDFSHPLSLEKLLQYACEKSVPIVLATTGYSHVQIESIYKAAEKIPVFFTANLSIGVNLIANLIKKAAAVLYENFDIEIIEKHHNQKIDSPSGTALMLADTINDVLDNKYNYIYDRHSVRKKRDKNEIGLHAIRGGTIVGEHSVIFAGTDEIIEIKHSAMSKEIFAVGAIKAAKFLVGKPSGLYCMQDVVSD